MKKKKSKPTVTRKGNIKSDTPDHFKPDTGADHTGTDLNADTTRLLEKIRKGKYDKPLRESDPDSTGIDTEADHTKSNSLKNEKRN